MQIIVVALAVGVVAFLLIAPALPLATEAQGDDKTVPPIITYVAIAHGLAALPIASLVSTLVVKSARRRIAAGSPAFGGLGTPEKTAEDGAAGPPGSNALLPVYVSKVIVAVAIPEGAAMFLAVAYMLDRSPIAVILAAVLAAAILLQSPTGDRARQWLEEQGRLVADEREGLT